MSVELTTADPTDAPRWDSYVDQSEQGGLFHQHAALETLAAHADAELHLLVGHVGQEPVGVFPIFELRKGLIKTAFSPPPKLRVSYLGPAFLNIEKLSQRKTERRQREFLEGCLDWLETECNPRFVHVRAGKNLRDLRPFIWNDYEVTPNYTYLVDLTPEKEDLIMGFSSDARKNIRNTEASSYQIRDGGTPEIHRIVEQVKLRYQSQDIPYDVPPEFVVDLFEQLPDGQLHPYVCRVDDEFAGGMLVLEYEDTVYRWQGGVRTDTDHDVPVNDLLDWRVMVDAIDGGLSTYDLVGANNKRINNYKAKFDPELEPFHSVEQGSPVTKRLASIYKRWR